MKFPGLFFIRNTLARATNGPVLSILIFHRVLPDSDRLGVGNLRAKEFAGMMKLASRNFDCVSLSQAVERLIAGTPGHMLAVTFDDGYADNHEIALPILRRCGIPATIFIATRYLDGGIMWNDRIGDSLARTRQTSVDLVSLGKQVLPLGNAVEREQARRVIIGALKYCPQDKRETLAIGIGKQLRVEPRRDLMLTRNQVAALGRELLIEIGGHTYSHPILACVDPATAAEEMTRGKRELEEITNDFVKGFAYPNGQPGHDYGPEHVDIAKRAGFSFAVSTQWGAAQSDTDLFQLPRFTPWRRGGPGFVASLLKVARAR